MSVTRVRVGALRRPAGSFVGRERSTNVSLTRCTVYVFAKSIVVVVVGRGAAVDDAVALPEVLHAVSSGASTTNAQPQTTARLTTTAGPRCRCRRGTPDRDPSCRA